MSCDIKRIDRGCNRQMLCLPGWATDWRIFHRLQGRYNILSPSSFHPPSYHHTVVQHLKEPLAETIDICGWSLGAYAACDIARAVPDRVRRLILVGVRPEYPQEEIQSVRQALREDARQCLQRFYRQCFLPAQKTDYRHFRRTWLADYLRRMERAELLRGLDYLSRQSLSSDEMPECDIILIQGEKDVVAPEQTARQLTATMPTSTFHVLPSTGHAAFMSPQFTSVLAHD